MISTYDREPVAIFSALNPHADGLGVAWAGERVSPNWFDSDSGEIALFCQSPVFPNHKSSSSAFTAIS